MSINRPLQNLVSTKGRFLIVLSLIVVITWTYMNSMALAFDYPKLNNRSLFVDNVTPGATTSYDISWSYPSATTIGSVRFLLCSDPYVLDPCSDTPPGDLSSAVLSNQSGITGFSILSQTADEIIITRPSAAAGTTQSLYTFDNVVNPTGVSAAFFIQIFTYPTSDASGTPNHMSSVASATTTPINITTVVPPILYFCAGLSIDTWCENVSGNHIDYGTLSAATGNFGTSQFGVATNAVGGYNVTINGDTMTSGFRTIDALNPAAAFTTGIKQFGLNLRANTSPPIGQDPIGDGIGTVDTDYNSPDLYQYVDGDTVASAVTGSLFNTFTVSYIVNVPPDQAAGVYNTTIAYICTAAF